MRMQQYMYILMKYAKTGRCLAIFMQHLDFRQHENVFSLKHTRNCTFYETGGHLISENHRTGAHKYRFLVVTH